MAIELRDATPEDFTAVYGRPLRSGVLTVDGEIAVVGCLMQRPDGRLFASFEIMDPKRLARHRVAAVLGLRKVLAHAPKPIFAGCFESRYPTAPKLFRFLGFRRTEEVQHNGNHVWVLEDATP